MTTDSTTVGAEHADLSTSAKAPVLIGLRSPLVGEGFEAHVDTSPEGITTSTERRELRLAGALHCASLGLPISPSFAEGWSSLSTTDHRTIRAWVDGPYKDKNLSVLLGRQTGLVALVIYPGGEERWERWSDGSRSLPRTVEFASAQCRSLIWHAGVDEVTNLRPAGFAVTGMALRGTNVSAFQTPAPGSDLKSKGDVWLAPTSADEVATIPLWLARSFISRSHPRSTNRTTRGRIRPRAL